MCVRRRYDLRDRKSEIVSYVYCNLPVERNVWEIDNTRNDINVTFIGQYQGKTGQKLFQRAKRCFDCETLSLILILLNEEQFKTCLVLSLDTLLTFTSLF